VIGHFLPEGAIISDEAATSGLGTAFIHGGCSPHDLLSLTGGSIGLGVPMATGAALACPDRKVIACRAMAVRCTTLQALWTQAREKLDVTPVNLRQPLLLHSQYRADARRRGESGPKALSMLDLHNPELDWVSLARGMGVEARERKPTPISHPHSPMR